jgi:hypothetical protein
MQISFTGFEQKVFLNNKPFCPKIYCGDGIVPAGFNAIRILLDLSERSLLQWNKQVLKGKESVDRGLAILWELDFALNEGSLDDDVRFLTFQLNIQHFNDKIWPIFKDNTLGASLYSGFFFKENLEYIKALAALLDDACSCFLFLDTTPFNRLSFFHSFNQEVFGHLHLFLKGPLVEQYPYAFPAFGWDHGASPLGYCAENYMSSCPESALPLGLCLSKNTPPSQFERALDFLGTAPFRVIPENLLNQEWEGIDDLILFPDFLSENAKRQVKGFLAAGGRVINFPNDVATLLPQGISHLSSLVSLR